MGIYAYNICDNAYLARNDKSEHDKSEAKRRSETKRSLGKE
jgi:hypothetical protein